MELAETYCKESYPLEKGNICKQMPFVYLFYNPDNHFYKIGITNNVKERIRTIRNQSGSNVELIGFIELEVNLDESSEYLERYLHKWFKSKRVRCEWFNLSLRDIFALKQLIFSIEGTNFHYIGMIELQ
jgi:hypothetical protein